MHSLTLVSIVVAILLAPIQINARSIPSSSLSRQIVNQQEVARPTESSAPVEELAELVKSSSAASASLPTDQIISELYARSDRLTPRQFSQLDKIVQSNEAHIPQQIDQKLESDPQILEASRNKRALGESRATEWMKQLLRQRPHPNKIIEQNFDVGNEAAVGRRSRRSFVDDEELLSGLEDQQLDLLVRALLQRQVMAKMRAELSSQKAKGAQPAKRNYQNEQANGRLLSILLANIAADQNQIPDSEDAALNLDNFHQVLENF